MGLDLELVLVLTRCATSPATSGRGRIEPVALDPVPGQGAIFVVPDEAVELDQWLLIESVPTLQAVRDAAVKSVAVAQSNRASMGLPRKEVKVILGAVITTLLQLYPGTTGPSRPC